MAKNPQTAAQLKAAMFNEGKLAYTAKDIRFTTKGGTLYAFCLGAPAEDIAIKSLGKDAKLADKPVASVELLGSSEKPDWTQNANALVIKKPAAPPSTAAIAYKITFAE